MVNRLLFTIPDSMSEDIPDIEGESIYNYDFLDLLPGFVSKELYTPKWMLDETYEDFPKLKVFTDYVITLFHIIYWQIAEVKDHKYQKIVESLYSAMGKAWKIFDMNHTDLGALTCFSTINIDLPIVLDSKVSNLIVRLVTKEPYVREDYLKDKEKVLENAGFIFHSFIGDDPKGEEFETCKTKTAIAKEFRPLTTDQLMEKLTEWCDSQSQDRLANLKFYAYNFW